VGENASAGYVGGREGGVVGHGPELGGLEMEG
jgi:hypothetical protein